MCLTTNRRILDGRKYPSVFRESQATLGQIYYDILFDQLQDIKGKRVLDFGSGFGLVANHLAQENQVLAIEPNEEMVALRTQDYPYQQLVGSLDQLEALRMLALMSFSATMSWSM